jgi:poly-gamma-glutamate synthesis protein (capsule biosynthesis protein)
MKILLFLLIVFLIGLGGAVGYGYLGNKPKGIQRIEQKQIQVKVVPTPTECKFTVAAVGDVMLGRSVQEQMEKKQDWTWPFASTATRLKQADITIGNLEAPLVTGCYQKENRYVLCTKPEAKAGLVKAGFDVVSLANNHTLNWGLAGYQETREVLAAEKIDTVDSGQWTEKTICGARVGFIGLDDVSRTLDLGEVRTQVASMAAQVEIPVVLIHWGIEYVDEPVARQREVANVLSEAGAKVVIGHHPHWVQPAEKIGETLVFWSLGNFVFDQMWSEETRMGEIAEIQFAADGGHLPAGEAGWAVRQYQVVPVRIYEYGQPRVVDSDQ